MSIPILLRPAQSFRLFRFPVHTHDPSPFRQVDLQFVGFVTQNSIDYLVDATMRERIEKVSVSIRSMMILCFLPNLIRDSVSRRDEKSRVPAILAPEITDEPKLHRIEFENRHDIPDDKRVEIDAQPGA